MATLLLMRHAKSSWKDAALPDHERPLNKRGERDAPRMAEWLQAHQLLPDRILSSSAVRAARTAAAIAELAACCVEIREDLYHASCREWQLQLREIYDNSTSSLAEESRVPPSAHLRVTLLVGHNPGLEEFVEHLSGEPHRMPTAAIAWFTQMTSHSSLATPDWELQTVWRPKEIF